MWEGTTQIRQESTIQIGQKCRIVLIMEWTLTLKYDFCTSHRVKSWWLFKMGFFFFISVEQPVRLSFLTPEQKICVVLNINYNLAAELNTSALWLPTPKFSQILGDFGSDSTAGHCGLDSFLMFLISNKTLWWQRLCTMWIDPDMEKLWCQGCLRGFYLWWGKYHIPYIFFPWHSWL